MNGQTKLPSEFTCPGLTGIVGEKSGYDSPPASAGRAKLKLEGLSYLLSSARQRYQDAIVA